MSGYDSGFLGEENSIDIPWFDYDIFADVLKSEELRRGYIVDYLHYSLVMSKSNRQAYLSLCNLDQTEYRSVKGRRWFTDPRIGEENQLDNRYYKGVDNHWDRGHLTRRTAITWGESDYIARRASNESCSYANASLQHKNFNQDEWRIPEKVAEQFDRDLDGKISIMTGPLFTESDRWLTLKEFNVPPGRIPSGFWKILYYVDKKKSQTENRKVLGCEAYLVNQDKLTLQDINDAKEVNIETLQVTITELADLTGIQFPQPLYDANPLWYYPRTDRDISEPEQYEIKVSGISDGVRSDWPGHVIHDREDITKHGFKRISL